MNLKVFELKVLDGDTIEIRRLEKSRKERIRILNIDAPETDQYSLVGRKKIGVYATNCLKKLLNNNPPKVELSKRDIYGRWLGDIVINHKKISLAMVENGCASLYPYSTFSSWKEKEKFIRAYLKAKRLKKGIWKWGGMIRPTYYRKMKKLKSQSKSGRH